MHAIVVGLPIFINKKSVPPFFSFLLDPIIQRYDKMWLSFYILLPYVMIDKKQDICLMDNVKLKGVNSSVGRISQGMLGTT
jgi:hypothetical protein